MFISRETTIGRSDRNGIVTVEVVQPANRHGSELFKLIRSTNARYFDRFDRRPAMPHQAVTTSMSKMGECIRLV